MPQPSAIGMDVCDQTGTITKIAPVGERLLVGRTSEAQIHLDRTTVSRRHAEFFLDRFGRWCVRDLGSRNGTFVNGQSVTGSDHPLHLFDNVAVGEFTLRVTQLPEDEGASVAVSDTEQASVTSLPELEPPRISSSHLSLLNEFGLRLLKVPTVEQRMRELCLLMIRDEFRGRCAMVLRMIREKPLEPPRVISPAELSPRFKGNAPYISKSLLKALARREEPLMASNVPNFEDMAEISLSPDVLAIATVAVPIRSDEKSMDVLYAVLPPECATSEWLALAALAAKQFQQTEMTLAAKDMAILEHELERARDIQHRLIPRQNPIPGLDVAIGFKPCRWVGGDYVDVASTQDGRVLLALADVCGKGLPAALVAHSLHAIVRIGIRAKLSLAQLAASLNEHLCDTLDGSFVTMVCMLIDPATGELECVNAGHPPILILKPDGQVVSLLSGANMPLGLTAEELMCERAQIAQGDAVALFSDGLIDLPGPNPEEHLGLARVNEMLGKLYAEHRSATCATMAETLSQRLDQLQGDGLSPDDRTFLLARRI